MLLNIYYASLSLLPCVIASSLPVQRHDPAPGSDGVQNANTVNPFFDAECRARNTNFISSGAEFARYCTSRLDYAQSCITSDTNPILELNFTCPEGTICHGYNKRTGQATETQNIFVKGWVPPVDTSPWDILCYFPAPGGAKVDPVGSSRDVYSDVYTPPSGAKKVIAKVTIGGDSSNTSFAVEIHRLEGGKFVPGKPQGYKYFDYNDTANPKYYDFAYDLPAGVNTAWQSRFESGLYRQNLLLISTEWGYL